jgi:hypothetical protein
MQRRAVIYTAIAGLFCVLLLPPLLIISAERVHDEIAVREFGQFSTMMLQLWCLCVHFLIWFASFVIFAALFVATKDILAGKEKP